jgi:hypothetical protein
MPQSYKPRTGWRPPPDPDSTPGHRADGIGPATPSRNQLVRPGEPSGARRGIGIFLALYVAVAILMVYLASEGVIDPKGTAIKTVGLVGFLILLGFPQYFLGWLRGRATRRG